VSTSPTAIQFVSSHEQTDFGAGDCKDENSLHTDQNSAASDLLVRSHHAPGGLPGNFEFELKHNSNTYAFAHACCTCGEFEFH